MMTTAKVLFLTISASTLWGCNCRPVSDATADASSSAEETAAADTLLLPDTIADIDSVVALTEEEIAARSRYLLGLYYGMNQNSAGKYVDSVLDRIPGMTHKEFSRIWYLPADSQKFEMSLGIYLDNHYPTDAVRKAVFTKMNSVIPKGFEYDIDARHEALLRKGVDAMQSTRDFLKGWENLFNKVGQINGYDRSYAGFHQVPSSRGCAVGHKIYEDSIWATYVVEMSYDYHISNGCPTFADYYSINKQTGEIFTRDEFLSRVKRSDAADKLRRAYVREVRYKGFDPGDFSGDELLDSIDGIAKIDGGTLFYYQPYKIGWGGEDQFNLIIDLE